jgi:hypothetical protein
MVNLQGNARRARLSVLVILALASLTSLPTHASVIYDSRSSSVAVYSCVGGPCINDYITDTTFDSFSQSVGNSQTAVGYASQTSQLSQSGISVNMQTIQGLNPLATGVSDFTVTFNVTTQTAFQLTGDAYYQFQSSSSSIAFNGPPCSIYTWPPCFSTNQSGTYTDDQISESGILQPGQYTLTVDAQAEGPALGAATTASATAQLTLTPVPLPASGTLLVTGLLLLLFLRATGRFWTLPGWLSDLPGPGKM